MNQHHANKAYVFPLLILVSILAGGYLGYLQPSQAIKLKPIGDTFIQALLWVVTPLIFFTMAMAVNQQSNGRNVFAILSRTFAAFIFTGLMAAIYMLCVVKLFPLTTQMTVPAANESLIIPSLTLNDFLKQFTTYNIISMTLFAIVVGLLSLWFDTKQKIFAHILMVGKNIFMRLTSLMMLFAPLGFFAYFAVMVADLGTQVLADYMEVTVLYYVAASIYLVLGFSLYILLAGYNLVSFWRVMPISLLTALATCSSAASIPANLTACRRMGIPDPVAETVIPFGAVLHKDGSVLGGVLKIAFLFALFHLEFTGVGVILTVIFVSILVGTVMGAIPGGGLLGEMVILSIYHFPPEVLLMIGAISIILDPLATVLNVSGDCVAGLLVARTLPQRVQFETIQESRV